MVVRGAATANFNVTKVFYANISEFPSRKVFMRIFFVILIENVAKRRYNMTRASSALGNGIGIEP